MIIDGKAIAAEIKENIKEEIERDYLSKGINPPKLACIIVEGNKASEVYVASKEKAFSFLWKRKKEMKIRKKRNEITI